MFFQNSLLVSGISNIIVINNSQFINCLWQVLAISLGRTSKHIPCLLIPGWRYLEAAMPTDFCAFNLRPSFVYELIQYDKEKFLKV